nr:unnamed protein product [Digitaria exilis]
MALLDSSSGLWTMLGQASNVAQLVGVDALGLVSMVVQAALAARRHRDACRRLAQHVEIVGGLLRELDLAELMEREATRRPLEQLGGALRRCYALVTACQDCGYLRRLLSGARMTEELRAAEKEIDMFIRLVPLIALVDTTHDRRAKVNFLSLSSRLLRECQAQSRIVQAITSGALDLQEQQTLDTEELLELCIRTEGCFSGFKRFEFSEIVDATDNFSENRNVGRGGFATVYKGQLPDGLVVAVKRMDEDATVFDFSNEFLLARLQHTNLNRLLGWCIHGKERVLVYDYMDKGSLHHFIFDHDMNPKITDFGSARTLSSDVAEERTSRIVGTSGFKAPEYTSQGIYSLKTDVFSFGVMALVIISGRKNTILEHQGDSVGTLVRDVSKHNVSKGLPSPNS